MPLASQVDDERGDILERLFAAATLRSQTDEVLAAIAADARAAGHTWIELGQVLGVTKQAVQKRFGEYVVDLSTPEGDAVLDPLDP